MQDFIQMAAGQLGISEDSGQSATSGILGLLQDKMGDDDFSGLTSALPGAAQMLAPKEPAGFGALGALGGLLGGGDKDEGPGLGALAGLAGSLTGNPSLGALGKLADAGLDLGKVAPFVGLFLQYVQSKAGQEMVGRLLSAMPELRGIGGDA